MASNDVIVRLRMLGAAAFESQATAAAKSIGGVGASADKAGKETGKLDKGTGKLRSTFSKFKGVAIAAGFTAVAAGAAKAVSATTDLAKSTMAIQRATGLDTKTASQWAEITKVRGINTKQFQVGLTKLSKTMEAARMGNQKARGTLLQYGVTSDQIAKGDVSGTITEVADAFQGMKNPAEKAAAAQGLFGKAGIALLPLLNQGSAGIQEQMDLVNKYGATIGNTKDAKELIARQRELKYATDGLKVSVGTALIPAMTQLATAFGAIVGAIQPILTSGTALKILVGALAYAFVVLKVNSMLAAFGMTTLNISILLIPLAIAAIAIALVVAYKKIKWFRDAVNAAIGFIKRNWKMLALGLVAPWALAVLLIARKFRGLPDRIRGLAGALLAAGKHLGKAVIDGIASFIKGAPGSIMDAIKSVIPGGKIGSKIAKALHIPGAQAGGTVARAGGVLVGEAGPEVVSLSRGARVLPLPSASLSPVPAIGGGAGGTFVAKLYLQNREVAQAVAQHTSDVIARR